MPIECDAMSTDTSHAHTKPFTVEERSRETEREIQRDVARSY